MRSMYLAFTVAIAALLFPATTFAASQSQRDGANDVKARGLSRADQLALDIRRVKVTVTDFGVTVDTTLAGSFEERTVAGGLRKAGAAVILTQTSGEVTTAATYGSGKKTRFARSGPGGAVAAVRNDRHVTLYIADYPVGTLARLDVRTFTRRRGAQSSRAIAAGDGEGDGIVYGPGDGIGFEVENLAASRGGCAAVVAELEKATTERDELKRRIKERQGRAAQLQRELRDASDASRPGIKKKLEKFERKVQTGKKELGRLEQWIAALAEYARRCPQGPGTGGGTGGGTGTGGTGGGGTQEYTCSAPTTQTNATYTKPGDPFNGTSWETATTGSCSGPYDSVEITVPEPYSIQEFIAEPPNCTLYDQDGNVISGTLAPGQRVERIVCTQDPSSPKSQWYFYLRYFSPPGPPPSGTPLHVVVRKAGATTHDFTTYVPY